MNLLASELLKLRTIRTPYVLLALATASSALASAAYVGSGSLDVDRALSLGQASAFGTLFVAVLGILTVTNEYRHGTITTTFLGEPRRVRVLLAKLAAAAVAGAVFAVASLAAAAAVALPWLADRGEALPLDAQALEAVGRVLLLFVLDALLGAAVGAVVQSQLGAVVGYFIWLFVVESVVSLVSSLLLTDLGEPDPITPYLPGNALQGVVGGEGSDYVLAGGPAALVAAAYVVGFAALGALAITRRDP